MRRKLQRVYWLGILIVMAAALFAVASLLIMKLQDTRQMLRSILYAASGWTMESAEDLPTLAEEIAAVSPPLRVTFVMEHGLVLADSEVDYVHMDNHFHRPEVQQALAGDVGESLRMSDTQANPAMYAAMRISPQLILRLSYPLSEVITLAAMYAGGLAALFFLLYLLQRRALAKFGNSMIRQMEDIRRLLEGDIKEVEAVFPEFRTSANQIAYLVQRLKNDLQEVSRTLNLRDNFVANASHELRSPLTSIMGFAEMLDTGLADTPEEQQLCLSMIRSECQRMLDVIQDILLLSRAEAGTGQEKTEVDVRALAEEICASMSAQAGQRGIKLHIEGEMKLNAVEKDLWEVLYNLVSNAVRYGRDGGNVWVRLAVGEMTVEDNGIGIAPEHIGHLFEQFYRVDETRGMAEGGTGLGLSIVKAIVERMGGGISVESTPGEGSRFCVNISG